MGAERASIRTQNIMLTFFKINHEHCLEWKDAQDPLVFVVVKVAATLDRGFSTCVFSDERCNSAITKKCTTGGRSTIKVVSQFDVALETGTNQFSADMPVMGIDALELFLSKSKSPFFHSGLTEVPMENRCIGLSCRQNLPNFCNRDMQVPRRQFRACYPFLFQFG